MTRPQSAAAVLSALVIGAGLSACGEDGDAGGATQDQPGATQGSPPATEPPADPREAAEGVEAESDKLATQLERGEITDEEYKRRFKELLEEARRPGVEAAAELAPKAAEIQRLTAELEELVRSGASPEELDRATKKLENFQRSLDELDAP